RENDGKLVHLVAQIDVEDMLRESEYGIAVPVIRLKRRVQMYQWVEEETSRTVEAADGQQVETSFNSPFNHENPRSLPLESRVQEAATAYVGAFRVTRELRDLFTRYTIFASDERPADRRIKLHGDIFYHCANIEAPNVGDIRVQFAYAGKAGDT
ncbi:transmembrane protein 43 homolog, partial [Pollicipes pollicipes]|uniref:transmembrane protein 43 homolog n=1 Tax=Pollicipes pollicipes TaxID=41117 RepID=UPI001884E7AF